MTVRAALTTGTVAAVAVTAAWSYTATLTIGAPAALHLTLRDLPGDYARLATAATGNGWALFAAVAVIYTVCFLASGWRQHRRLRGGG
jgi:hypothetical protein